MEEKGAELMPAVAEAFRYKKRNPMAAEEEVMQHIAKLVKQEKREDVKMGMFSAASKTLQIVERNPKLNEKEVIKQVVKEIPNIISIIKEE